MSDLPPPLSPLPGSPPAARPRRRGRGFFPPQVVKAVAFFIISVCIVASVVVCILAIWDFAKKDALWRLVASFVVVAAGTALFAMVNGIFGDDQS
ncbi:MAG: hypothetical protein NVV63_06445 [Opitutus sp.]|nr:hypothetical protein [Opitutus sp.]